MNGRPTQTMLADKLRSVGGGHVVSAASASARRRHFQCIFISGLVHKQPILEPI